MTEEHFSEYHSVNLNQISDIVENFDLRCPIVNTFQIILNLAQTDTRQVFESMYNEFEDISRLLLKGLFSEVDMNCYLRSVYLTFFDRLLTSFTITAQIHHSAMTDEDNQSGGP